MNNSSILDAILRSEGWPQFTNHSDDRGGPTRGGITLRTLQDHRPMQVVTVDDLQALTEDEAREIYLSSYIVAPGFDKIHDDLLRWQVVDCGVLSGQRRAVKWIQEAAGTEADGKLGPKSLAAINGQPAHALGIRLCSIRARALARIVTDDKSQATFAAGWMNRCMEFAEREALRFLELEAR